MAHQFHISHIMESSELPIKHIIQKKLVTCGIDKPIWEAAKIMREAVVSSIVVTENNNPVGIWTEGDVSHLDFSNNEVYNYAVSDLMNSPVKTISDKISIMDAAIKMSNDNVRHYLVTDDDGIPYGMLSQTDLIVTPSVEGFLKTYKVQRALNSIPIRINQGVLFSEAANRLSKLNADAIFVEYDDGEYGILTQRDLIRYLSEKSGNHPIGLMASRPLITIQDTESLLNARDTLVEKNIRHLGVMNKKNELIGFINFSDILRAVEGLVLEEFKASYVAREKAISAASHNLILLETVMEKSKDAVIFTDEKGLIFSANPSFTKITGYEESEVIGKSPGILKSGKHNSDFYRKLWRELIQTGTWSGEIWNKRKNGDLYLEQVSIHTVNDTTQDTIYYLGILSDITDTENKKTKIHELTNYNALTGLPNRNYILTRLQLMINYAKVHEQILPVIHLFIDKIDDINTTLGYESGDKVILETSDRIKENLRNIDAVGHIEGAHFIVSFSHIVTPTKVNSLIEKLIRDLEKPIVLDNNEIVPTIKAGISIYPLDSETPEDLLHCAKIAKKTAMLSNEGKYKFFKKDTLHKMHELLEIDRLLTKGIENDEFVIHYQPLVDPKNEKICSMEALVRWQKSKTELAMPDSFIPFAEKNGLITDIGYVVLNKTAQVISQLKKSTKVDQKFRIGINISPIQIRQKDFLERFSMILSQHNVTPADVYFELTENSLIELHQHNDRILKKINAMGIQLALDDFGTGYSSFSYLQDLPISIVKIDKSFLTEVPGLKKSKVILEALVNMIRSLGMTVVIEGVETKEQSDYLKSIDVDIVQGYFFGRPNEIQKYFSDISL